MVARRRLGVAVYIRKYRKYMCIQVYTDMWIVCALYTSTDIWVYTDICSIWALYISTEICAETDTYAILVTYTSTEICLRTDTCAILVTYTSTETCAALRSTSCLDNILLQRKSWHPCQRQASLPAARLVRLRLSDLIPPPISRRFRGLQRFWLSCFLF